MQQQHTNNNKRLHYLCSNYMRNRKHKTNCGRFCGKYIERSGQASYRLGEPGLVSRTIVWSWWHHLTVELC